MSVSFCVGYVNDIYTTVTRFSGTVKLNAQCLTPAESDGRQPRTTGLRSGLAYLAGVR